ncbi:class I SAM-dependent methyltransferase [Desulfocurvus sp. DL9XJH121]
MPPPDDEYARIAALYEPLVGPLLAGLRRDLAQRARDLGARRVLDLCCGTGAQLDALSSGAALRVGADISPAMLRAARTATSEDIAYLRCDAGRLSLAPGSFDLCVLTFALHEKPEPLRRAMLAEALRVTAPGGAVVVADYAAPRGRGPRLGLAMAAVVERMAGHAHHGLFRDFLAQGGLPGLLDRSGVSWAPAGRRFLGAVLLAELRPAGR